MHSEVEPPQKKKTNSSPSFLSLPDDIILNCLDRVSRSYYPKLSLVCKTFCSLVSSKRLFRARFHLRKREQILFVCLQLQLTNHERPSWFALWKKPDQTLTNDLNKDDHLSTGNTRLVPIPTSYSPRVPSFKVRSGSDLYGFPQNKAPSPVMRVFKGIGLWQKAPNMNVARNNAVADVLNEKIYVVGGCESNDESANWGEVFDPKTQIWEPLPDPGVKISFSKVKTVEGRQGKLYVRSYKHDYVYDPTDGKWHLAKGTLKYVEKIFKCWIENVWYGFDKSRCVWFDSNSKTMRKVRDLDMLNRHLRYRVIETATYSGKILIVWDKLVCPGRHKHIWCAVISFERRNDDEVWGNIEWASVVLKVPSSYIFVRSQVKKI